MTDRPSLHATFPVGVRLFARYAELLDSGYLTVSVARGATVADAIAAIRQHPGGESLPVRVLVARNQAQADPADPLEEGDELALLPPMAGG